MATPSDLTQTGETLILQMANAANPTLVNGALTASNVTLGAVSTATGSLNSQITLTGVAGQGYTGSVTLTYNRLDIQTGVMAILAPSGATLPNANFATINDLIAPLNAAYNLGLVAADVTNDTSALTLTNGAGTATLTIAATSLKYLGTLNVTITQTQTALSSVVTTTTLSGLNPPA